MTSFVSCAHAQVPTPAVANAQPSLQDLFNAASDAAAAGDCAKALPLFASLAVDQRVKPGTLPAAAIALRRGRCLVATGHIDDGEVLIEQGLPTMRNAGADFADDVGGAELVLGNLAAVHHDQGSAVAHYQAALAIMVGEWRITPLLRLAEVTAFDGGARPLNYADEALKIASAKAQPDKKELAILHDVHGRILLNQGQIQAAYTELKQALALSGGLTERVTHADIELRGDLAQAALLNGDRDQARNYLAYTGAGHMVQSPFAIAASMHAPDCGSETGLQPDDIAIVAFAIGADGSVQGAQTVYTRGNYAVATAFARAVNTWFWRPEDVAKIPPFFRQLTSIEVRCSNSGGNLPGIHTPLVRRFVGWAQSAMPTLPSDLSTAALKLQALRDAGDAAASRGDLTAAVAALGLRAMADPRVDRAQVQAFEDVLKLAQKANIPAEVMNALQVLTFERQVAEIVNKRDHHQHVSDWANILPLSDQPPLVHDALAADTLRLLAIPYKPDGADLGPAQALAQHVADDTGLPDHAPLRQEALLWLANDAARAGRADVAQAYFQRTGLDEEQCALIGPKPAMRASGASDNDFPTEALSMGFEGWVNMEFNINADGSTAAPRALMSYPPFVFENAATSMARKIRYERSFRPGGGQACSAAQTSIRFNIPSLH